MKIVEIHAKEVYMELIQPIEIALGRITKSSTVVVQIKTDNGLEGYGEGSGIPFVTGETSETILSAIQYMKERLLGIDVFAIARIHKIMDEAFSYNTSAKAAIDIALYDLMAKHAKMPLYRYLGGVQNKLETDMTIGINTPEEMGRQAVHLVKQGFRYIKVKAGRDSRHDIMAVKKIREEVGEQVHIKVDANQGWSEKEAVDTIKKMSLLGVNIIEQPCKAWDTDALSHIRKSTSMNIMADESCFSPVDALELVKKKAVDSINIKLMKCGGLYKAMQINTIAEAAGLFCMVGCMMESRIGISAGAALISSSDNISYCDLDSFLYFKEVEQIQGGFESKIPYLTLSNEYGLGVSVAY